MVVAVCFSPMLAQPHVPARLTCWWFSNTRADQDWDKTRQTFGNGSRQVYEWFIDNLNDKKHQCFLHNADSCNWMLLTRGTPFFFAVASAPFPGKVQEGDGRTVSFNTFRCLVLNMQIWFHCSHKLWVFSVSIYSWRKTMQMSITNN